MLVKTTYESALAKAKEGKEVRNLDNLVRTGLITAVQRKKIEAEYAKATADGTIVLEKQSQAQDESNQKVVEATKAINEVIDALEKKDTTNKKVEKSEVELANKLEETAVSLKTTANEVKNEVDNFVTGQVTKSGALDDFTSKYGEQSGVMTSLSQDWTKQTETWLSDSIVNMELDLDGLVKYFERSIAQMVVQAA